MTCEHAYIVSLSPRSECKHWNCCEDVSSGEWNYGGMGSLNLAPTTEPTESKHQSIALKISKLQRQRFVLYRCAHLERKRHEAGRRGADKMVHPRDSTALVVLPCLMHVDRMPGVVVPHTLWESIMVSAKPLERSPVQPPLTLPANRCTCDSRATNAPVSSAGKDANAPFYILKLLLALLSGYVVQIVVASNYQYSSHCLIYE